MWVGFWAAAFPDADFIVSFIDPIAYLTVHRGITHSVIMLPFWALGLAFLFALIVRQRYSWKAFAAVCALGIGIHIAGDVITAFGTMIFAPFSNWRAQIPTTFIIDLYFTSIIIAGLIASMRWKTARTPAVIGLAVLTGYVGFQAFLYGLALSVGNAYIAAHDLNPARAHAIPQPFSPFNWMVVVEQPKSYRLAYISLLRKEAPSPPPGNASWLRRVYASYRPANEARWQLVQRYGAIEADAKLAEAAWSSESLARYRHFALFPAMYRLDRGRTRTCVWFNDLRFALAGRTMPFRYGACRDGANAPWKLDHPVSNDSGTELFEAFPD